MSLILKSCKTLAFSNGMFEMVLPRNVGTKLLLLILYSGDGRSKTETVTQQMVAKHQQEMTTKIINHADKRHSLRSSL